MTQYLKTWNIKIDWNNDGSFAVGENEKAFFRDITIKRGRDFFLGKGNSGFEPIAPGECTIILDNQDDRYNPFNTSSPLYPNVQPGRKVQVSVQLGMFDTYSLFTGWVNDIQPSGGTDRTVTISCVDSLQMLTDREDVDIPLQVAPTVYEAFYNGLIAAGWSLSKHGGLVIDDNTDRLSYFWLAEDNLFDSFDSLAQAWMGKFFVDVYGQVNYFSRNHPYTVHRTIADDDCGKDISILMPWEVIRNTVSVFSYGRLKAAETDVWKMSEPLYMNPGEITDVFAEFEYNGKCPADELVNPTIYTDFKLTSDPEGVGTDYSNFLDVTPTFNAQSAQLHLRNRWTAGAWVSLLKIRGKPVYTEKSPTKAITNDSSSASSYNEKSMVIDSQYCQNYNFARDYAYYLVGRIKNPSKYPTLIFSAQDDIIVNMELFDEYDLEIAALGISGIYHVSSIELSLADGQPQDLEAVVTFELPLGDSTGYWTFSTNIGTTSYLGF